MKFMMFRTLSVMGVLALAPGLTAPANAQPFTKTNLVSDIPGMAATTDPLLVNPWGVALNPTNSFMVANEGSKTATQYAVDPISGAVTKVQPNLTFVGFPAGSIYNPSTDFVIAQGSATGPARFIFSSLAGEIWAWDPNFQAPGIATPGILTAIGTRPVTYTGLALGMRGSDQFLYAANNATNRIDVYNATFGLVKVHGNFTDPVLPANDFVYNIVNIGGSLYATYYGPTGVINVFDTDGNFVKRFATGGTIVNPWGIAQAPSGFGKFGGALLVGNSNLGNPTVAPGWISAFDLSTGKFLGLLLGTDNNPVTIDGLWTLVFGSGGMGGDPNTLYFSAGIYNQTHGLFGSLAALPACQGQGPLISQVSASPGVLWPPNHEMVPVTIGYTVADTCDAAPACSLSVASNEGASSDWQVVSGHEVELRAERAGNGGGRTYTITINCKDKGSLSSSATTVVLVPHDQGHKK